MLTSARHRQIPPRPHRHRLRVILIQQPSKAVSALFDKDNPYRTLSRTTTRQPTLKFIGSATRHPEILPPCYPFVEIRHQIRTQIQRKSDAGLEQTGVQHLSAAMCYFLCQSPSTLNLSPSTQPALARVTLTGGYVLPGYLASSAGQTALPTSSRTSRPEHVSTGIPATGDEGSGSSSFDGAITDRYLLGFRAVGSSFRSSRI